MVYVHWLGLFRDGFVLSTGMLRQNIIEEVERE
jgi:hypothetical protein